MVVAADEPLDAVVLDELESDDELVEESDEALEVDFSLLDSPSLAGLSVDRLPLPTESVR